jgi:transmembrane sensor
MNRPTQDPDPAAEDQASLWAARLEGAELTSRDRSELDAWLAGGAARRELLSSYCQFSAKLDRLVPELVAAGSVAMPAAGAPSRVHWNPWKVAAAALAAAALAVAVVWTGSRRAGPENIATPAGQRGSFTLADGTRVELNANTRIFVENGSAERRVRLANGEAFFVVSKDKARPFIVETPAGSVQVLGTIFNVLTEASSKLDVTVVEGRVQVRPGEASGGSAAGGAPFTLTANTVLTAENGSSSVQGLSNAEIEDNLAWRHGQIVCVAMPLSEALAQFARYHGRVITVTPGAGRQTLGGRYNIDHLDDFLDVITHSLNVNVTHGANGTVRVSLSTEP